jgi:hypothetical protein
MPIGTRVATFHGMGAQLPPGYEQVDALRFDEGMLRFYVRRNPRLARLFPHDFHNNPGLFDKRLEPRQPSPDSSRADPLAHLVAATDPPAPE